MKHLFTLAMAAICFKISIAQKFEKQQPDILYAVDKNGDTTGVKVGFGTANPTEEVDVRGTVNTDTIKVSRVIPPDGDSLIHFGENSLVYNPSLNRLSWTPAVSIFCSGLGLRGFTFANGASGAGGNNSMALGNNVITGCNADNSFAVGLGVSNNLPNTFQLGFNSVTLFADATSVGINNIAPTHNLDINGNVRIRNVQAVASPNSLLVGVNQEGVNDLSVRRVAFTGNSSDVLLGDGTFGPAPGANAWLLTGNTNSTNLSKLGATNPGKNLNIYAGGQQSMFIDGSLTPTIGFIGIGDGFITPRSRLHLNQPGTLNSLYMQFTNDDSGNSSAGDGFRIGINSNTTQTPNVPNAEIRNEEDAPITFHTASGTNVLERMRITRGSVVTPMGTTNNNVTRVAITYAGNPIVNPVSLLHLGASLVPQTFGHRAWMDAGTFTFFGSDNIYVGMKRDEEINNPFQGDIYDAVINWGDNVGPALPGGPIGPDNLRFIFTAPLGGNLNDRNNSGGTHGLEVMRMIPQGRIGIGSVFTQPLPPQRRLDILTDFQNNALQGEPQLRLTFQQNTNVNNGIFTDFQTTSNGDLAVLPFNSFLDPAGLQPRNVGIQTTTPRRRLDVFDDGDATVDGRPQLRLTQTDLIKWTDFQTTLLGDLYINPTDDNQISPANERFVGIHKIDPGNTVEINSQATSSATAPDAGLRFTKLRPTSPIQNPNSTNTVLSVDNDGDVILVNNQAGGGFFTCNPGTPTSADDLPFDSWWEMKDFNFVFSGQGVTGNTVGIGITGCTPAAKLDVLQNSTSTSTIGINVINRDIGVSSTSSSVGLKSFAGPHGTNRFRIAGWFEAPPIITGAPAVAIYVPKDGGKISVGAADPFALSTSAQIEITGDIYGSSSSYGQGYVTFSDRKLKKDTTPFAEGLNVIRDIKTVSFKYNGKAGLDTSKTFVGVIAEDVAEIAPFAIDTFYAKLDSSDTSAMALLAVNSEAIMYATVNAVKELDSIVTAMSSSPSSGAVTTSGSPSAGVVSVFTSDSTIGNSNIYDNGTNVGIGTTSPTSKLHITGTGSDPSAGSLRISDSNGSPILQARNDGKISFGSSNSVPAAKYEFINNSANPTPFERTLQIEHNATGGNHAAMVINCNDNGSGNTAGLAIGGSYTGLNSGALSVSGNAFIGESGGNNSGVLLRMTSNTKQYGINLTQSASIPSESSYGVLVVNNSTGGSACCGANPQYNYGVFAQMTANTAPADAMVAARFDSPDYGLLVPTGKVGIGTLFPTHLLELGQNDAFKPGDEFWDYPSDVNLKENIQPFSDGLEIIRQINPIRYQYNGKANMPTGETHVGIIAQDVIQFAPYVIDTFLAKLDTGDTMMTQLLSANTSPLLYVAFNAIKQLDSAMTVQNTDSLVQTIDSLKDQVTAMQQQLASIQNCIDNLPSGMGCDHSRKSNPDDRKGKKESQQINLESSGAAILYQNEPNPFGNSTVIRYYIPEAPSPSERAGAEVYLVFYDEFGREISKEILTGKGYSKVDVNAEKLAAGIYTYSIIVDGKIADTKKMIRSK